MIAGNNVVGKVTLTSPAPAGGETINIISDNPNMFPGRSLFFPGGTQVKAFSFDLMGVDATTDLKLYAYDNAVTAIGILTMKPATLASFSFSPAQVVGGVNTSGVITLNGAAGPSGVTVNLTSGSSKVVLPVSVKVAAQVKTAVFTVPTGGVTGTVPTTHIAHQGSLVTTNATLTLKGATLQSLTLNKAGVIGGNNVVLTARLNGTAPSGGVTVALQTASSLVNLPATITVPAGKVAGAVSFNPRGVDVDVLQVALKGHTNASDTNVVYLDVLAAQLVSVAFSPSTQLNGTAASLVLTLNGLIGPSGGAVHLTTGYGSKITPPATVVLPAQTKTKAVAVPTTLVDTDTAVSVTGTLAGTSLTGGLTIKEAKVTSLQALSTPTAGQSFTMKINLTGRAGPSGRTITYSGTVDGPATLFVPAGATSVTGVYSVPANAQGTFVSMSFAGPDGDTVYADYLI
ncbi:MAG: hypothetical protein ABUL72_01100 [Armatimonadota bacterium]